MFTVESEEGPFKGPSSQRDMNPTRTRFKLYMYM